MTTIFDLIADATRRNILDLLNEKPHSVGELVDALEISQPGVSKQLRILREAGLVSVRREGQKRWYELRPEPLLEIYHWLANYRQVWEERLDQLDDYINQLKDKE